MEARKPNSFKEEHMKELNQVGPRGFDCTQVEATDISSYAVAAVMLAVASGNEEFFQLGDKLSNELHRRTMEVLSKTRTWRQKFMVFRDYVMQEAMCDGSICGSRGPSMYPVARTSIHEASVSNDGDERPLQRKKFLVRTSFEDEDRRTPEEEKPPLSRPMKRKRVCPPDVEESGGTRDSRSPPRRKGTRLVPRLIAHNSKEAVELQERRYLRYVHDGTNFNPRRVL